MTETIQAAFLISTAISTLFAGVAAVMKVHYYGKAHLRRAERGDPELPCEPSLLRLLLLQRRTRIMERRQNQLQLFG